MQLAELAKVRAGQQRECRSQAGRGGEAATHSLPAGSVQSPGSWILLPGPALAGSVGPCPSITNSILVFLFATCTQAFK